MTKTSNGSVQPSEFKPARRGTNRSGWVEKIFKFFLVMIFVSVCAHGLIAMMEKKIGLLFTPQCIVEKIKGRSEILASCNGGIFKLWKG